MVLTWLGVLAEEVSAVDAAGVLHPTGLDSHGQRGHTRKGTVINVRETMAERGP